MKLESFILIFTVLQIFPDLASANSRIKRDAKEIQIQELKNQILQIQVKMVEEKQRHEIIEQQKNAEIQRLQNFINAVKEEEKQKCERMSGSSFTEVMAKQICETVVEIKFSNVK